MSIKCLANHYFKKIHTGCLISILLWFFLGFFVIFLRYAFRIHSWISSSHNSFIWFRNSFGLQRKEKKSYRVFHVKNCNSYNFKKGWFIFESLYLLCKVDCFHDFCGSRSICPDEWISIWNFVFLKFLLEWSKRLSPNFQCPKRKIKMTRQEFAM